MTDKQSFTKLKDIVKQKNRLKPPAYQWQELSLKVIQELNIPKFKRNAVFKVCRNNPKQIIEQCLNDTKELAEYDKWKYFFKLIGQNK